MLANQTFKRRKSSLIPIVAVILMSVSFVFYNYTLKQAYNPNKEYYELLNEKKIFGFNQWKLMLEHCPEGPESCQPSGNYVYEQNFPAANDAKFLDLIASLRSGPLPPTHATILYNLNEQEVSWVMGRNDLTILIPRSVQNSATLILPSREITYDEYGANLYYNLNFSDLKDFRTVKIRFDIKDFPWFGPADLPIVMGGVEGIYEYSRLTDRQNFTGNIGRALELSTRLLVALMAIVLDHSRPFAYLALFAIGRSLRDINAIIIEFGLEISLLNNIHFYNFVNALCTTALIVFFAALFQIRYRFKQQIMIFSGFLSALYIWWSLSGEEQLWRYADLISDCFGCMLALGIMAYAWYAHRQQKSEKNSAGSKPQAQQQLQRILLGTGVLLRNSLLVAGLLAHLYFNLQVFWEVQIDPFKDMLDIKNFVLSYVMVLAALTEVGSTSKAMFAFSKKMVKQATMEKDLEIGRRVQQEMLPTRKYATETWSWRTLYVPATELAGDWFDLRVLQLKDGRSLLAGAICDVTGHGVGAAMMTSTISSHWGLWCRSLEQDNDETIASLEARFSEAIQSIHAGLSCLRTNQGATGAFFLIDPNTWQMLYANPGHPGIIVTSGQDFQYLTGKGPRMGGSDFSVSLQKHQLQPGDEVFLFTDGIFPPKEALARHLNRCKKAMRDEGRSLTEVLISGIRKNRRLFRQDSGLEDDMTFMRIRIERDSSALKQAI